MGSKVIGKQHTQEKPYRCIVTLYDRHRRWLTQEAGKLGISQSTLMRLLIEGAIISDALGPLKEYIQSMQSME